MSTIYQAADGTSVYDSNGQTINAKTGQLYTPTKVTQSAPVASTAPSLTPTNAVVPGNNNAAATTPQTNPIPINNTANAVVPGNNNAAAPTNSTATTSNLASGTTILLPDSRSAIWNGTKWTLPSGSDIPADYQAYAQQQLQKLTQPQQTTPQANSAQNTPVAATQTNTPAAQTQTNGQTSPQPAGAAAGAVAPINYNKLPTETIDQYNARIAAAGGPVAPSSTSTGAASTVDTNYQLQPGESIDAYSARIAAYNANKPVTQVSGQVGGSGTLAQTQQTNGAPDPYAGLDPIQKQVKMYTDAYQALGLNTIKQQFDDYTKQQKDLTDEMNQKIADTQNNPWLSQSVSDRTVKRIKDSYATKLDSLTNLLTLTDSMYKQGQAQVDHMVSDANADIKATNDLAQKQIDAANALAKDNQVVSTGGRELLVNKETGKTIADLGPTNPLASASADFNLSPGQVRYDANGKVIASLPAKPTQQTQADQTQNTINQVGSLFEPGATIPGSGGVPFLDSSGNATPQGWNTALQSSGLPRATFIKNFGYLLVNAGNTISPKFGLTPVEVKSLTGALSTS